MESFDGDNLVLPLVAMARRTEGRLQQPFEDELLSCWHWRVASHYSSSPRQVEKWISGASGCSTSYLSSHDIFIDESVTRLWALACRLRYIDLERLSQQATGRNRASFVSDAAHRGVCPACLDEDAEEGRDHYCRQLWACVEAVVCPGTELASRLTAARVLAAVCFSFGRHPPE